uniref:Uncharacterized protein n=1 Tax=Setaria digitata TaxID=48799 RepID=A0A915PQV7_9BILA
MVCCSANVSCMMCSTACNANASCMVCSTACNANASCTVCSTACSANVSCMNVGAENFNGRSIIDRVSESYHIPSRLLVFRFQLIQFFAIQPSDCLDKDIFWLFGNRSSNCLEIVLQQLATVIRDDMLDVSRKSLKLHKLIALCQESFTSLEKCAKPVIASIHGHCIGAGISLVACADIRYASANAIFSIKEVDIGLAADVGILNRINKLVGNDSLTREFAYTARNFNSSEALNYGFISRIFDSNEECLSAALSLADNIAMRSPIAIQGTKLALNYSRDHPIDDSIQMIRLWNQAHLQSDDLLQAGAAAFSNQKPKFNDA